MNQHFNLSTIFKLLDSKIYKKQERPPYGYKTITTFAEQDYFMALRFFQSFKSETKTIVREVWLYPAGGGLNLLQITERKKLAQETMETV